MIFLSFASNFNFKSALKHLFKKGNKHSQSKLKSYLKKYYHAEQITLYANGRSALSEAITQLVPAKMRVAINGLTCYAVVQAVFAANCEPAYIDINTKDFNFDIQKLSDTLKQDPKIRAIILQNHLGLAADIQAVQKLAKRHRLVIIEDLAHCAGSHYPDHREMGTIGDAVAFSFGKDKSIDTSEGGALLLRKSSSKKNLAVQSLPSFARQFRNRLYPILAWTIRKTYPIKLGKLLSMLAFKTKLITRSADSSPDAQLTLPAWQAELALAQFKNLPELAKNRHDIAAKYADFGTASPLRLPFLINRRDEIIKQLHKNGIFLDDSWYQTPISPKRYYKKTNFNEKLCPNAVKVAKTMINLPLLPPEKLKVALDLIEQEKLKYVS